MKECCTPKFHVLMIGFRKFVFGTSMLQGLGFAPMPLPHSNEVPLVETAGNIGPPGAGTQLRAAVLNVTAAEAILPPCSAGCTTPAVPVNSELGTTDPGNTTEKPVGTALKPVVLALVTPT